MHYNHFCCELAAVPGSFKRENHASLAVASSLAVSESERILYRTEPFPSTKIVRYWRADLYIVGESGAIDQSAEWSTVEG